MIIASIITLLLLIPIIILAMIELLVYSILFTVWWVVMWCFENIRKLFVQEKKETYEDLIKKYCKK